MEVTILLVSSISHFPPLCMFNFIEKKALDFILASTFLKKNHFIKFYWWADHLSSGDCDICKLLPCLTHYLQICRD